MILAVDVGGDRQSYGFMLVLNSLKQQYGEIVQYCSNKDLTSVNVSQYPIILFSFMFVENYLHFASIMRKLKLEFDPNKRKQFIIVGGSPISENPEPIADFIDIAVIGEGEWAIRDIVKIIFQCRLEKTLALEQIYEEVDCAYVPKFYAPKYNSDERVISDTGRKVILRNEDPNRAIELPGKYTRGKKGENQLVEYSLEYHRGCRRRCTFCSYSHLQGRYREVEKECLIREINAIQKFDVTAANKIILIQTNLFHIDFEIIELLKLYDKLPNYSSACFADLYVKKYHPILDFINRTQMYLRFGIEDFTEEGRQRLKKPIPDWMLVNLPVLFHTRGHHFKFFFISSLPWQTIEDIQHFETVMEELSKKLTYYTTIDCFVTVLNYKLNCELVQYEKKFNAAVEEYLATKMRRKYGKLTLKIFKNQGESAFLETNILSLGNRKVGQVLVGCETDKKYTRKKFLSLSEKNMSISGLLKAYHCSNMYPSWYIVRPNAVDEPI